MSSSLKTLMSAFSGRSRRSGVAVGRHRVRSHKRGKPRGGMTFVRQYRRRNHR
ncbi:MAG: hypothetical protein QGG42_02075 [Phycisphaerae bacterium]|jgi:hypothetical protein|nr:hypothetical protein [Phycisphaerae bacterium]